jgi:hypothetical protein
MIGLVVKNSVQSVVSTTVLIVATLTSAPYTDPTGVVYYDPGDDPYTFSATAVALFTMDDTDGQALQNTDGSVITIY